MNAKELIDILRTMPQNLDIVFMHPEFGEYGLIEGVYTIDTEANCQGDYCDKCTQCEEFKKKDNAIELTW